MSSPDRWCRRVFRAVAHSVSLYGGKDLDKYDSDDSLIDNEAVEDDEEESEVQLDDGDEAWEDEMEEWERELEERAEHCGHTRDDFEEMIMYGIRPYDIDAYVSPSIQRCIQ